VEQLLAEIMLFVKDHPEMEPLVLQNLQSILAKSNGTKNSEGNPDSSLNYKHLQAYIDIQAQCNIFGVASVNIKDFRYLARRVLRGAGIADEPPSKHQSVLYQKLDAHWNTLRSVMLSALTNLLQSQLSK
jgi:hypothetical protein